MSKSFSDITQAPWIVDVWLMVNIRYTREIMRIQLCAPSSADAWLTINIRLLEARGVPDCVLRQRLLLSSSW